MLTLISFILTMVGAINWFCIGILQFDFVAGLFGSQSSIFSRIIYAIIGVGAIMVLINLIQNKGKIMFDFSKKKTAIRESNKAYAMETAPELSKPAQETKIKPEPINNQNGSNFENNGNFESPNNNNNNNNLSNYQNPNNENDNISY